MGYYINPVNETKEEFLEKHGQRVKKEELKIVSDSLPVVLIDNGDFTAAGICYDEKELREFTDPQDYRPKKYYQVPREALIPFYKE